MTHTPRTGPVTKEEIYAAAEALRERGTSVTQEAVRTECGNRGSQSTINKHLKAWRVEHEEITSRISREVTPEIELHSLDLIAKISEIFGLKADERCNQLEALNKAEIAKREKELDDACAEADQYHMSLGVAEERITQLSAALAASVAAGDQYLDEAKTLREKIVALEADREVNLLTIQQGQQQIERQKVQNDQALTSVGRLEGVASQLRDQLLEKGKQLTDATRIIGGYEESLMRANEEIACLSVQIRNLAKRHAGLELANTLLLGTRELRLPKPTGHDLVPRG
ncbi:hypothetical protein LCGC14_1263520 [marine sediment metagenome]|uniref:KfrA N-terminal DNA-binding domain-containing protein n=1 Tax=marine sediment metagenome TaxID=412755 RepID=A0A0F9LLD3_9ZZZZ